MVFNFFFFFFLLSFIDICKIIYFRTHFHRCTIHWTWVISNYGVHLLKARLVNKNSRSHCKKRYPFSSRYKFIALESPSVNLFNQAGTKIFKKAKVFSISIFNFVAVRIPSHCLFVTVSSYNVKQPKFFLLVL